MKQKIREYIDDLFENAPKTRAAVELKEEIISNAEEKLEDLLSQGYREEDAFGIVIHSIGNVEELFEELRSEEGGARYKMEVTEKLQKKKALLTAAAVGMYIFAGAVFFFFGMMETYYHFDIAALGLVIAALICIAPTCMLVYSSMIYPPYKKKEDNMVEEYKAWKSGAGREKAVSNAISTIIWTLGLTCYFVISFSTGAWEITWVIFLILGCLEGIVSLLFSLKRKD